ncbi:ubiquitin carboxyl-terminal hydrolase MINDY-1-like [Panicum virgatum]|uniref:ubiquitin carboxyl-terminal hydrolase MINDY-1-like n=1 Tax=Panicum virgatum TaxID=38727 RepID=UPI0019D603D2|nr:ubiquitin carboxyl-terminal hydrolase MINDY-1-like [Panicum virgatum]XP_039773618.1 ubiquitin carboxyl-terminal hydrolase MINDY-1-like [Panicum virgatum]
MVSGITESKSEIVSGVSQNASKKKKKKNKDEKKRKSDGQSLQSHSAPQLSPAFESSLKDDENTTATVGESGPSYPLLPDKGKELAPCSDTPAHSSMQGPNAKPLDFSSLRGEFCHTRIIRFMGGKYRILLQDKDGPCSLIAISNYLILKGRMTLPNLMEVCLESVAELVYVEVFKNMKNEEYSEVMDVLVQSAKGLDIDILFLSVDGFEDTPQYRIFGTLGIPLYHSCMLNLDLEEDASTFSAIEGRSFDQLHLDHYKQTGPSSVMSDIEKTQFDRIDRFLKVANSQTTDYGFSTLKKNTNNGDLFVFFWSNHFTIVLKENGTLYRLLTDVRHQSSKFAWQVFDNLNARGEFLEDVLILSNLGKDLEVRTAPKVLRNTPVTPIPSVSVSSKSVEKTPLSRGRFKTQFATFFTGSKDKKAENKFLEFLRRYK